MHWLEPFYFERSEGTHIASSFVLIFQGVNRNDRSDRRNCKMVQ